MAKKRVDIDDTQTISNGETLRWGVGLLLFLVGLFSVVSSLFYYVDWSADYSILNGVNSDSPKFYLEQISNPCGKLGAWIGEVLIGRSFGVVGIVLPIVLTILGVRVLRSQSMRLNKTLFSGALILLLGSLSFGSLFPKFEIFNSGLGGAFGIEVSGLLMGAIGGVGTMILLIFGWIATGVFINRNFIRSVNRAGGAAVNSGGKIVDMVKGSVKIKSPQGREVQVEESPAEMSDEVLQELLQEFEQEQLNPLSAITSEDIAEFSAEPTEPEAPEEDDFEIIELTTEEAQQEPIEPQAEEQPTEDDNIILLDDDQEEEQEEEQGVVITVESNTAELVDEEDIESKLYDPLKDLNNYKSPSVSLLEDYMSDFEVSDEEIYENKSRIEETLKHFGIPISKIKATVGPTITLYEIVQAQGVKISKIQGLENDIAQSLMALGIRIIAPIPGRGTIGIEVPNRRKQIVSMYSAIRSAKFQEFKAELPIVIGRTIQNENYVFDLAKMPHLLVAGATGQGKSVGLNAIITSLLYRKHPAELKLVMIDPKMVEFTPYKNLEHHFMAKMESEDDVIITDPKKAVYTLNALCEEMEKRLKLLSAAAVRNITEYNDKFRKRRLNPENGHFFMPYIVVVVDEFADLIMMTREVEAPVMRLAQKARAVGIHLIIATQRPDVKVITGGIKANFPARIAFRVMQMIDSRTIIDQPGANQLIGRGDLLFSKDGELTRIQCALVETDEVERIVTHIASQQGYTEAYRLPDYVPEGSGDIDLGSESGAPVKYDVLFAEIARTAVAGGAISTSYIQRNFEVGFNRAGRIMSQLERTGIVGRQEGAKPRDILYHDSLSLEAKLQELGVG